VKSKLTDTKTSLNRDRQARETHCIFDHLDILQWISALSVFNAAW